MRPRAVESRDALLVHPLPLALDLVPLLRGEAREVVVEGREARGSTSGTGSQRCAMPGLGQRASPPPRWGRGRARPRARSRRRASRRTAASTREEGRGARRGVGDEEARARGRRERDGDDELRVVGDARALRGAGPRPVEDELALAVPLRYAGAAATSRSPSRKTGGSGTQPVSPPTQPVASSASSHAWERKGAARAPSSASHAAAGDSRIEGCTRTSRGIRDPQE